MDPSELLRIVDAIHRDKNIDKEIVFEGIEAAMVSAAKKRFGEDSEVEIHIDRRTARSRAPTTACRWRRTKSASESAPRPPSR